MMRITTSAGRTYEADWVDVSSISGNVNLQMQDARRLPEIAKEFDGLKWLERESEQQGDKRFEGYSRLVSIRSEVDDRVLISMSRGGNDG